MPVLRKELNAQKQHQHKVQEPKIYRVQHCNTTESTAMIAG